MRRDATYEHSLTGRHVPERRDAGADAGADADDAPAMSAARRVLAEVFGFAAFRPGQEAAIEAVLAGRNVLAVMPTGSGKSLCFQVPALIREGLTVVVSPLVALMQDQVAALRLVGVAADGIHSGNGRAENVAAWRRAASGATRLLYMAPERLMTERMLAALSRLPVALFAIDEAHCISQWGPSFRPEYGDLRELRERFPGVPIAALTATADEVTRADVAEKLFGGDVESFVLGFDRPNIALAVETKREWKRQLRSFVARHEGASGIVYCLSRKRTEEAAELLAAAGVRALPYHAGMDKEVREEHQNVFMTEPGVVIVATIAFGMGIDKADVRYVFHTDLPGSVEAYYQEIGRAGRDGARAEAHMLYGLADIRMRRRFIEDEDAGEERKRREHKRLDALLGYCEAPACRRVTLLAYFGEGIAPCGNCDVCLDPSGRTDGTEDALKVLSAALRTGERFGAAHLVDLLRGTETEKITRFGHQRLPTFGAGAERGKNAWRSIIRQMIATGFLRLDMTGYGSIAVTDRGRALLRGEGEFRYREDTLIDGPPPPRGRRERHATLPEPALDDGDATMLAALKALRLDLAKERGVPAYVVFPDRTLVDMVRRRPQSEAEFAEVNGVGAAKLKQFAAPFLAAINDLPANRQT
ncbi:MAG: DNA helicase RecQ [Immundisolibacterales bacterium]|nr:DNA helicase RecQ [Immundisolibacterales bacterium]